MNRLGVEEAFEQLDRAPDVVQEVLRPVLIRAMQDPATMRALGEHALTPHLFAVGSLLHAMHGAPELGPPRALPRDAQTFEQWMAGTGLEDAEEAFNYVSSLTKDERRSVEVGLGLAPTVARHVGGPLSLLALARLLRLALENETFNAHVLAGGEVEPFLPPDETRHRDARTAAPSAPTGTRRGTSSSTHPEQQAVAGGAGPLPLLPGLAHFVGKHVQLLVRPEAQGSLTGVDGVCADISSNHVIVVGEMGVILFGMNSVFRLVVLSDTKDV